MNNLLSTGQGYIETLGVIIIFILGIVAVRITLNFDVNKYLEDKHRRAVQKLRNMCTHVRITAHPDGGIEGRSLFISPPGTIQWQCQRCGLLVFSQDSDLNKAVSYYMSHLKIYGEREKKFKKLLKKSERL